jgi:ADP-heptose:LPS heptosyltransferase
VEINLKIARALLQLLGQPNPPDIPVFQLPAATEELQHKLAILRGQTYIRNETEPNRLVPDVPSSPQVMPSATSGEFPAKHECILVPGTTWITKIWPEDHWYQLGIKLIERFNYRLLIIGSRGEADVNRRLCEKLNAFKNDAAIDLTNKTSLLELSALFPEVDLVVGSDTGPLHLAAATGRTRVVGIYGSTPCLRNGPYGLQCRSVSLQIACQPCYSKQCKYHTLDCLRNLPVEKVMLTIEELVASPVLEARMHKVAVKD